MRNERRLAAARGADQRHHLAVCDREAHPLQRMHDLDPAVAAEREILRHVDEADLAHSRSAARIWRGPL